MCKSIIPFSNYSIWIILICHLNNNNSLRFDVEWVSTHPQKIIVFGFH